MAGLVSDYNDLRTSGTYLGYSNNQSVINLAAWRSITGQDMHSVSVNPHFPSWEDLHTTVVPLNNSGIAISGITTDYDGVTRGNPPDIGAYEISGTPPPLPVPTISGPTQACQGSTGVYKTQAGMSDYVWSVTGMSIVSGGTSNDSTLTVSLNVPVITRSV